MRKSRMNRHHKGATSKNDDTDVQKLIKKYPPEIKPHHVHLDSEISHDHMIT